MSRIISLVSLIIIIGGMGYAYYTGLFGQVFDPKVRVMVAAQNLVEGQPVRPANLELVEVPLASINASDIVYPDATKASEVAGQFTASLIARQVQKGERLEFGHFKAKTEGYVMRVINEIAAGDPLDRSNVVVVESVDSNENGVITFSDNVSAFQTYLDDSVLKATRDMQQGAVIRVSDVAGDTGAVWVMESRGDFQSGDLLSLDDIDLQARPTADIPRGAVAFPSKQAGEIFISTSGGITIGKGLNTGDVFVVNTITKTGGTELTDGQLPRSLHELLEYQAKFPRSTIFVDEKVLVGSEPVEGDSLNLWVETGSTEGPYGVIKISKIAAAAKTFRVTNTVQTDDGPVEESKYWANIGRSAHTAMDEARAEDRVAFMVSDRTSISDFLGNGAVCRDDQCSVSRSVSDDLSIVRLAFTEGGELVEASEREINDPLTLLDGVDAEIERRLHRRNYMSFRDIASWEDAAMKVIAFNLEISQNLAVYIRQQARNLIENPEKSRRDLGLTNGELSE